MGEKEVFLALDIGVGMGTKLGLFEGVHHQISEDLVAAESYGESYSDFLNTLVVRIENHVNHIGRRPPGDRNFLCRDTGQ